MTINGVYWNKFTINSLQASTKLCITIMLLYIQEVFLYIQEVCRGWCGVAKNQTILIRVTEEQKDAIKRTSISMRMTVTEFLLYGAMKTISEVELNESIKYDINRGNGQGRYK